MIGHKGTWAFCLVSVFAGFCNAAEIPRTYRSPHAVAFSPDRDVVAVADWTARTLVLITAESGHRRAHAVLQGRPVDLVWSPDGTCIYAAEYDTESVAEVTTSGTVVRRIAVGSRPVSIAIAPHRRRLLVSNGAGNTVSILNVDAGRREAIIRLEYPPHSVAVSPDERVAVAASRLPTGDAADPQASAVVTIIDLNRLQTAAVIRLPPNSTNVMGLGIDPRGRWVYALHNLGRTALPTTQIEYGWINANALTIIDLQKQRRHATVLLDRPEKGAANPWDVGVTRDGATLWVTISGTHELGRVDCRQLHRLLAQQRGVARGKGTPSADGPVDAYVRGSQSAAAADPSSVELVVSDRPAAYGMGVYLPGVFRRYPLPGNGPRGLAVSPDGRRLAVALYFSGTVAVVDAAKGTVVGTHAVGLQGEADAARRGAMIFHDATYCYQQWMSCATCHPDGRADGLNWDLMNDGVGNPKNTRSLVLADRTPPVMSRAVRAGMTAAVAAGFHHILYKEAAPRTVQDVAAYIRTLRPEPSPFLVDGQLSAKAQHGKAIFESETTGCSRCHPPPLFTDLGSYDVGTRSDLDWDKEGAFDTPSLREVWRTGPYLHHGKATTLGAVLSTYNREDRHGKTTELSPEAREALIEYLKSL